ncbi:MAG: Metallophosphoesterase [Methanoculleus marisnigri]|uniref:Metallophosphoesterase n=1 Tax=Methanoculleus marisnigri TaxID=2198 RepID=A0A101GT13_9EURY|nr:MAG: Metallophosphoesterase [Methanoculleus marisnigri]
MPATRVLAFSDLAWGTGERGAPARRKVDETSFLRRVEEADPAIVVFAGDAAYDRCSRSGLDETELFLGLLCEIAAAGRHCVVVEGNNDDTMGTYGRVRDAAEASPYLHEVSGEIRDVCGIHFLGVPTGKEKRMARSAEGPVDIVVAHAPLANRVWLFDLPAACVITGHYGMMAGVVAGKAYIALDCSPASYAVIDWEEEWQRIEYAAGTCRIVVRREEGVAATGCDPALLRDLTEGWGEVPYHDEVEALRRAEGGGRRARSRTSGVRKPSGACSRWGSKRRISSGTSGCGRLKPTFHDSTCSGGCRSRSRPIALAENALYSC